MLIFTKPTCASFLVSAPSIVCESGLSCLFHAGKKYALEKIINFFFIENQKHISIIYWCNVSFVSQYIYNTHEVGMGKDMRKQLFFLQYSISVGVHLALTNRCPQYRLVAQWCKCLAYMQTARDQFPTVTWFVFSNKNIFNVKITF